MNACAIIHRRKVEAEIEGDKESLFTDPATILVIGLPNCADESTWPCGHERTEENSVRRPSRKATTSCRERHHGG